MEKIFQAKCYTFNLGECGYNLWCNTMETLPGLCGEKTPGKEQITTDSR